MKIAWTDTEISKLIEILGDKTIQKQFESCTQNRDVYERIATLMCKEGYDRTWTQCCDKIKKKEDYRRLEIKTSRLGISIKTNFYKTTNEVMADKPNTQLQLQLKSILFS